MTRMTDHRGAHGPAYPVNHQRGRRIGVHVALLEVTDRSANIASVPAWYHEAIARTCHELLMCPSYVRCIELGERPELYSAM